MKKAREKKRPREDESEVIVPLKKQPTEPNYYAKQIFELVFPFLFPGQYEWNAPLCFRTYLALAGTCKSLRYFNVLRRWIGFLCPTSLTHRLWSHGYPVCIAFREVPLMQSMVSERLMAIEHFKKIRSPFFSYLGLEKHFGFFSEYSSFHVTLGEIPFFNVFKCEDPGSRTHVGWRTFVYLAPTFAEAVLFCYAALSHPSDFNNGYAVLPMWKCKKKDTIHFFDSKKETFLKKKLLGGLKKMGNTAPIEVGFSHGGLPETAYSLFCLLCDTSGSKRSVEPVVRLENFIKAYYPKRLFDDNHCSAIPIKFVY